MNKKRVLIYPCGTEIALEIYRSLRYSIHYEPVGGADGPGHGDYVFDEIINGLPFISDDSSEDDIRRFEELISGKHIDFIYPAMDGVISVFASYRRLFSETLILPDTDTAMMCRSKKKTYGCLSGIVDVPVIYDTVDQIPVFPVFIKPDVGQGSVGARLISNEQELAGISVKDYVVMEYLPGAEYTVDCFTNDAGRLIFARGRRRNRIRNGISVNTSYVTDERFEQIAVRINSAVRQRGGWFFQLKEDAEGELKLLEVAARIAGTSAISRNLGANLPLMTVDLYNGIPIEDMALNDYQIILDRALDNSYKIDLSYSTVYIDYDDTIVHDGVINTAVMRYIYQCINRGIKIVLLTRHDGDLDSELHRYRLSEVFDEIVHLQHGARKCEYITDTDSIFIDDSYGERKQVRTETGIPVFDTHMLECLIQN